MSQQFPHLFTSITLRHKILKNRIVFGAHTANMSEGGLPTERHFGYYRERARGGAASVRSTAAPVTVLLPRACRSAPGSEPGN